MKLPLSIIFHLLFIGTTFAQISKPESFSGKSIIFRDTLFQFVTDSFNHNLGTIPSSYKNKLVKHFKYVGEEPAIIIRAWTHDPHYICEWPKEPLEKNKIYSFTVCFFFEGRNGSFEKQMGFDLTNGKKITYKFCGTIKQKNKLNVNTND
ncbi:MAG: DUF1573 domain-containing protein [Bacteroidia bacterium]|nr:DUF1573 domain-containing protein [Bacteroidia bacterium]